MKSILCGLVMMAASTTYHANNTRGVEHGNNPDQMIALMTYLHMLAPDIYDGLMEVATPLIECIDGAIMTCGEGNVCSVCVINNEVCSFQCRDEDGHCPAPVECGSRPDPVVG